MLPPDLSHDSACVFEEAEFLQSLNQNNLKELLSSALAKVNRNLDERFRQGENVDTLIHQRAAFFDRMLYHAWQQFGFDDKISLVAVGGYGRGELQPHSDIDLLLLLAKDNGTDYQSRIEQFLTLLWDLRLDVGHSVRTIDQCVESARADITVATSLMECRTIAGDDTLREQMHDHTGPTYIWPATDFFAAKRDEQNARHARHGTTEYDLEPNVKESPGGLRDIQTVTWIARRYYHVQTLDQLKGKKFFSKKELNTLRRGEKFLRRVRYGLHMLSGRAQERLQFDLQRELADMFGYRDSKQRLGVEKFMQDYYRTVMQLRVLNEVFMQFLQEAVLKDPTEEVITPVNKHFQLRGGYLEARNNQVFAEHPAALLEIFLQLASTPNAKGLRASAIRQIQTHTNLIDDEFRNNIYHRKLFISLFRLENHLSTVLQLMTRYGVLGRYLPEFGRIVGRMQHDLFHIYPVDVHTLQVLKNIRLFGRKTGQEKFPLAATIYKKLEKKELLLIAGLYHDIAKGRGGDHSTLGARDVRAFATRHRMTKREGNILAWLVQHHLLMSQTSQKQDISDPEIINAFARQVQDQLHLDLLYALTVADINATNPDLWNSWKASLLSQLYIETGKALARGLENPVDRKQWIQDTRKQALELLKNDGVTRKEALALWENVGDEYFLQESATNIAWHTKAITEYDSDQPMVLIKSAEITATEGATQIFVRTKDRENIFAALAAALDRVHLSIHDAKLYNSTSGYTLDTFYVLDENNQPIGDNPARLRLIRRSVTKELKLLDKYSAIVRRRTSRQLKHFPVSTTTSLTNDKKKNYSILEVTTADRAGLLAQIGRIFVEFGIRVQAAKIATLGERVEDVFFITDSNGNMLGDKALVTELQQCIRQQIDSHTSSEF